MKRFDLHTKSNYSQLTQRKYRVRKVYFWVGLSLVAFFLIFRVYVYPFLIAETSKEFINVAICGEVQHPGIYQIPEGADLALLIKVAGGTTDKADFKKINIETVVKNDSVYYIPARIDVKNEISLKNALISLQKDSFNYLSSQLLKNYPIENEIKQTSFLYICFPAIFLLVNYVPEIERISITQIPHSSVFLSNSYRLIDLFLTLGIDPTINMLEKRMGQRIPFYLIQDKFSIIDLIDMIEGIDISIDAPFAEAAKIKAGFGHLNGEKTWEFIRFIDLKRIKKDYSIEKKHEDISDKKPEIKPSEWQLAYEMRNQRVRAVLKSMRSSFSKLNKVTQADIIYKISKTFETNMSFTSLISLYTSMLGSTHFSYGTLPGYYNNEGNNLYYYPDVPSYRLLQHQQNKDALQKTEKEQQIVY